ncbi:MAG: serine--tRNA ligase [Candidatus Yonathbacteria bacterium]|nr:serine--tRNA ligase [Candidatus Yonathbacteria bacterium]
MLDIKFIREFKDLIAAGAKKKHIDFDVDTLLAVDEKRRGLLLEVETMKAEQNVVSKEIALVSSEERETKIAQMQILKEKLQGKDAELKEVMKDWQALMVQVPNIPDMSVPEGDSDADNVEVRTWGDKPEFSFVPKSHVDLMLAHDMVDLERGAKVAGFRGYFLKNDGVRLSMAIWQLAQEHFGAKGFSPMMVPSLVRREPFIGTGYLPQSEEDLYKTQDGDFLSGTGEVATMGYFMDETIAKEELPKKFLSFSPCFRREAGSHGKDTRGLIRVHEFFKWEQVILCEASHEESVRHHEALTANAEEFIQKLGLPYHVVANCGGDLGLGQVKKYDIEVWVPAEETYRETHSSSYFHDFQTRRLNLRYRDADGTLRFAHSLNNTAVATPRLLVSIVENYQQADGSILIPEALRPYMGKEKIG